MKKIHELCLPHPASAAAPIVTVSIGVAVAGQEERCTDGELVERADKALYRAKALGRDRVCLYGEDDVCLRGEV